MRFCGNLSTDISPLANKLSRAEKFIGLWNFWWLRSVINRAYETSFGQTDAPELTMYTAMSSSGIERKKKQSHVGAYIIHFPL